jgi:hypothetical protein
LWWELEEAISTNNHGLVRHDYGREMHGDGRTRGYDKIITSPGATKKETIMFSLISWDAVINLMLLFKKSANPRHFSEKVSV